MSTVTLYHVSPSFNKASIEKEGVSPDYSRGRGKRCYWVTEAALMWAIAHISSRHDVPVNRLHVFVTSLPFEALQRSGRYGVFYARGVIHPNYDFPAYVRVREIPI